ncbi:DUF2911 domain-containing protein [Polaribacter sp. Hel1_85]|uniref:DUF2911 domain-containing protein n=1 Tax=Polaribacter sp. Hel1_85 TaxID=1250005 RepID=UPI00052CED0B|nr:DUF2911 domain-containing protein [Polaribacter sp. Hel1_85]KGL62680.1 hypothetical protein PHEL85_2474 [Polaribacter sp. Hel1_85]
MKNSFLSLIVIAISIISSTDTFSQKFPRLDVSPMDAATYPTHWKNSDKLVKVIYGRPQLKGRALSALAVADTKKGVWRTGANEAPEVTFFKDILFAGKKVKAGTYTLFTIPGENEWTLILSSVRNVWGHYTYDKNNDVLRVSGKVTESEKTIEAFSIAFDKNKDDIVTMFIGWGNTVVSVPLQEFVTEN